jgi:hypothetical protein
VERSAVLPIPANCIGVLTKTFVCADTREPQVSPLRRTKAVLLRSK